MKSFALFSFLNNREAKAKLIFFVIIFISILVVFLDAFSIFTILPIISMISDTVDLQDKFSHLRFFPETLLSFIENLDYKSIFLILILILLCRNLIYIFYQYLVFRFVKYLEVDTYKKLFFLLINKDYLNFYNQTSNELIKNFQTSVIQYLSYSEMIARIISDTSILFLYLLFLFYISPEETLFIFLYFSIIFLIFRKILSNFSFRYGKTYNSTASSLNLTILNTFKNFSQIILRNLKKKYTAIFSEIIIKHSFSRLIINFVKTINRQFLEISLLTLIIIAFYVLNKIYSVSEFVTLSTIYIAAAYRIMPVVNSLIASYVKLRNYEYGFNIICNQMNSFNKKYKKIYFSTVKKDKYKFKKQISLKSINFKFNSAAIKTFSNLNLKINKNKMIGIIGESGAGKTTLIKILLGLIKPNSGKILVDGKNLNYKKKENYYLLYSYLPQENLFIPGTIKENIAFGQDNINTEKVLEVLKETNCMKFVKKLKKNINSEIIENGKNFSVGQLQRFALARALYFESEILILDEPTSALDKNSENKFLKLIKKLKKKKTIIIISHKSTSLKDCDKVYKMSQNRLISTTIKHHSI